MRLAIMFIAAASLAACDSPEGTSGAAAEDGAVTLELPPERLPPVPAPAPEPAESAPVPQPPEPPEKEEPAAPEAKAKEAPAPAKAEEPPATEPTAEPKRIEEARPAGGRPPLGNAAIASTIDRIGYRCGSVVSASRVEEANAAGEPVYRIACSSGETYRGTDRGGRMYFRPWTGRLGGR